MADVVAPPSIAAPPAVSAPVAPAAPAIATPQTHDTPHEPGGEPAVAAKPSKVEFELDGRKFDFDTEEPKPEDDARGAEEFKFQDLEKIKDTEPELYKTLKRRLSEHSRFATKFKTPEELDSHLERVERLSGGQGIEKLEEVVNRVATDLQNFRNGDAGQFAKEAPEEFATAAEKLADTWGQTDATSYVAYLAKAAMQAFTSKDASGQSALDALTAAYQATTDPVVKKLLERTFYTLNTINENSLYKPDATKLRQRQLDQRDAAIFSQEVDQRTDPVITQALRTALDKMLGDATVSAEDRKSYMTDMKKQFLAAAKKNTRFMRALGQAQQSKSLDEITNLTKEFRGEFAVEAAKQLYRSRLSKLKDSIKQEASSHTEAGSSAGSQAATPSAKWTGGMKPDGTPQANFDYQKMK